VFCTFEALTTCRLAVNCVIQCAVQVSTSRAQRQCLLKIRDAPKIRPKLRLGWILTIFA